MRVGLPPSPSIDVARTRAPLVLRALVAVPGLQLVVAESYLALGDQLLSGHLTAAWAPPIVCARVELAGGRAALRAVRGGVTSYRAALVCRADDDIDWARPERYTAAWVDEDSAAGYLLARSYLAARRIDALTAFRAASFAGSYMAALDAVLEGKADVTSCYFAPESAPPRSALEELPEEKRARLRVCATTGETQTDGVVLAPGVLDDDVRILVDALEFLGNTSDGRIALREVFQCEELRPVPLRLTSPALRDLLALQPR
jgi:phosphonate transport system substrate-binding protein